MRNKVLSIVAVGVVAASGIACGSSGSTSGSNGDGSSSSSGGRSGSSSGAASGSSSGPSSSSGGSGGSSGSSSGGTASSAVSFPQAVHGAMWVDPAAYVTIPVHVAAPSGSQSVSIALDGGMSVAATLGSDGTWVAQLSVASVAAGTHTLVANADGATAQATLGVGSNGMQMTDVTKVGNAGTARLLKLAGGGTYVTWTDRSGTNADGYLQAIDGAGTWLGSKVSIVHAGADAFYARTAASDDGASIGVLYQTGTPSNPYTSYLKVVDATGKDVVAAIALDPQGMYGSYGGDVAWDGSAFVATWRSNDGAGSSSLYWVRLAPDGTKTGPVTVTPLAEDGGQADGGFDAITPLHIAAANGMSALAYVQYHDEALLGSIVPKSRVTVVDSTGAVVKSSYCGDSEDTEWHTEARSFVVGGAFGSLWGAHDLSSSATNPPTVFFGATLDASQAPGAPVTVVNEPYDRAEQFVVAHPTEHAVATWTDLRSEDANPTAGHIQLFAATVDASMKEGTEVIFDHARFIEGTSELAAMTAGTNVLLVWLDERHGGGIDDPKPEVWMDTVWY